MHAWPTPNLPRRLPAAAAAQCGGSAAAVDAARPLLSCMGRQVIHCGPTGSGQAAKMCNNLVLAVSSLAPSLPPAWGPGLQCVAACAEQPRMGQQCGQQHMPQSISTASW